jgi:hypothetical protein
MISSGRFVGTDWEAIHSVGVHHNVDDELQISILDLPH